MRFKKPTQELSWDIYQNAFMTCQTSLWNDLGDKPSTSSLIEAISRAVAAANKEAFETMMLAQYTDSDFESDIGLKS